jgi:hypothetical protein
MILFFRDSVILMTATDFVRRFYKYIYVDPCRFTFYLQAFLMVVIMVSGNYNFFNFLYLALCLSLADNSWLRRESCNGSSVFFNVFNVPVLEWYECIVVPKGRGSWC